MKIGKNTLLRKLNFTYYDNLDDFDNFISEIYRSDNNPFIKIKYQFETCPETGRPHVQGFTYLKKRIRVGEYKLDKKLKGITIKNIFKSNSIHIEWANDIEASLAYVGKKYNKCKIHHNSKNNKICRCDLQELTLGECKLCNKRCCSRRTLARCDEEN